MARQKATITSIEQHPNLPEILGVLSQLPHVGDRDLPRLAAAWHNTAYVAGARARALEPDSPLILDVLNAFEAIGDLFADDVAGDRDFITVDPAVTIVALKSVRDAIAGAFARPILGRGEHAALLAPWRTVYPVHRLGEPDLGPHGSALKRLLDALPLLATRCHDPAADGTYQRLASLAWHLDATLIETARTEAWQAAVLTARRRLWLMLRRSAAEGLGRQCPVCPPRPLDDDLYRVLTLCQDAACALLVADAVDQTLTDVLTLPLGELLPSQRTAGHD
jgi:hypothetical protein